MASTIGPEVPPFAASSGAFTALTGDATSTSSGGATTVLGIQGVAQTVATATILSQLNNARTRTLAASLVAGEETVYTGAGGVTATLPATGTQNSTCNVIVNTTSGVITLAAGAGTTLVNGVTTGNISMASGTAYAVVYITSSTTWYVYATAGVGGGGGSFTALTGDATSTATGGATTVLGINGTLLSSLATGILKNTTGTGVPSIAVANTDYAPVANPTFTGVVTAPAYSATGLTGAVAATRYVGGTTQGAPASGTFVKGDWIVDQTATIWVCTASGSPGVWSPETPNSLILRSATATAGLGEQTIFTGSTAAQSITFPANPANGAVYAIKNLSSVAVSVLGGTNSISVSGVIYTAAVPYTIPINTAYTFTYDGTGVWYMLVTTDMGKVGGTLPVANGGTASTTAGAALTNLGAQAGPLAGDVTTSGAAATLVGTANVNTVVGALATVAAKAPLASPTFSGVATAPVFSASGITGATAPSRYIGAWTGPGSPLSGTFSVGDWGVDEGSPTVWVCTTAGTIGAGCVFQNIATITSSAALSLALTETVSYLPTSPVKGNTAFIAIQNETLSWNPPVSGIVASSIAITAITYVTTVVTFTATAHGKIVGEQVVVGGVTGFGTNPNGTWTITSKTANTFTCTVTTSPTSGTYGGTGATAAWWTITLAANIIGTGTPNTLGVLGDTFPCWTSGFLPVGWNVGNGLSTIQACVTALNTVTVGQAGTPTSITQWGILANNQQQYSFWGSPGFQAPRAIVNIEGTNTFNQSVNHTYGIGPVFQNLMTYVNGSPYTATWTTISGSNIYKIAGDQRALVAPTGMAIGSGITANAQISGVYYDGTNTSILLYVQNTYTPVNYASTTTVSLTIIANITTGEAYVNSPQTYGSVGAASFPLNPSTFAKPGQGQGWSLGYWHGPVFAGISGGSLANINDTAFIAMLFLGASTTATMRYGYLFDDVQSLSSTGAGGTLATQIGLLAGHLNNDLSVDQLYGATTNVGSLMSGPEFGPAMTPYTTVNATATINAGLFVGSGGPPKTGGTGVVTVVSTLGFPATGTIKIVASQGLYFYITYTGTTSTTFTGCTYQSGSYPATVTTTAVGSSVLGCNAYNNGTAIPLTVGATFTLPVPATGKMALTSTGAVSSATTQVITGTPAYDGQMLRLVNVGSNIITFNSGGTTGLSLSTAAYLLQPKGSLNLQWDAILGLWVQANGTGGVTTVARPVARVTTISVPGSAATYNTDTLDVLNLTGLNGTCNLATSQTGTPAIGDQLVIHVTDNGTARTLSYGSKFESGPAVLPTTTQISVMLTMQFIWNDLTSKWRCVGSSAGATSTAAAATVTTPTFTSGTATQLANTSQDAMIYLDITLAGTLTVAIGPTSTPANTLYPSVAVSTATAFPSIRLPAGWYIKVTAVTATYTANVITC